MKNVVSVIVPVYNVEKYLKKSLDSLVNQTFKDIEIILVNDGSTDNSLKICEEYAKKYNNIVVINQKNQGMAVARNNGIASAKGNYYAFLDSDDYFDIDTIEELYNSCKENDSDIACCGTYREDKEGNYFYKHCLENKTTFDNVTALRKMILNEGVDPSVCNKMFKAELWEDIQFPIGKYYEDLATTYKLLYKANKISHIGKAKYHYVIRQGSITNQKFSLKQLHLVTSWQEICDFCQNIEETLYDAAMSRYYLSVVTVILQMKKDKVEKKYREEYRSNTSIIRKNIKLIISNKYMETKKKIMCFMVYLHLEGIVNFIMKMRLYIKLHEG